ncbi:MAG: phosphoribosyl-AMP cyclohydrolase / phosphoribosyl-ATP pyrophosphohydrolase [Halanaerobiales bacterium]|nr:phosphoribosyl-AMP cyclohydrolase / phosphoribosyl-ATP pyrophosphohydrolase [Halanaerobiales bacterium]
MDFLDEIKFDEKGLIPAVLQDAENNEVLMVAYMNRESLRKTLETGKACFWSRSRQELWLKGETSGNYQYVEEIRLDCDNDTLLVRVKPAGPACHIGNQTCFYRKIIEQGKPAKLSKVEQNENEEDDFIKKALFLKDLYRLIRERKANPVPDSYTSYLFREGVDKVCKKVGEETAEVIIGAKNESNREIIYEVADLIYHLLVLLNIFDISLEDVLTELEERRK